METKGIQRPQRWDEPFDPDVTESDLDRILVLPPFNRMDPDKFPPNASLRDILRNDVGIRQYKKGDIVFSKGEYGNSAFFVSAGSVSVLIEDIPAKILGRRENKRRSLYGSLTQLWRNHREPEVRDIHRYTDPSLVNVREGEQTRIFLQDVPSILNEHKTVQIGGGGIFGEIAALGRTPRTATVFADDDTEIFEIRWQGLRDIMRRVKDMKEYIDQLYRSRSLVAHLRETPIFKHLTDTDLRIVAKETKFETFGDSAMGINIGAKTVEHQQRGRWEHAEEESSRFDHTWARAWEVWVPFGVGIVGLLALVYALIGGAPCHYIPAGIAFCSRP